MENKISSLGESEFQTHKLEVSSDNEVYLIYIIENGRSYMSTCTCKSKKQGNCMHVYRFFASIQSGLNSEGLLLQQTLIQKFLNTQAGRIMLNKARKMTALVPYCLKCKNESQLEKQYNSKIKQFLGIKNEPKFYCQHCQSSVSF